MPLKILYPLKKSLRKRSKSKIRVGRRNHLMKILMKKKSRRIMGGWSLYLKSAVTRVRSWGSLRHRCFTLGKWFLGRIGPMALALCLLKIQDR